MLARNNTMDTFNDDPFEPISSFSRGGKAGDINDLMEEGWFFGKLLNTKPPKILRSNSDPIPRFDDDDPRSSTGSPSITRKLAGGQLVRAPSLPPYVGREDEKVNGQEIRVTRPEGSNFMTKQSSDLTLTRKPMKPSSLVKIEQQRGVHNEHVQSNVAGLRRMPSLPLHFGRNDEDDDDGDESDDEISMSRLIRQAMPSSFVSSCPRRNGKSVAQIPKYRPPRGSSTAPDHNPQYPIGTGDRQPNLPAGGTLRKTLSWNLENQRVAEALLPDDNFQWRGKSNERDQLMVRGKMPMLVGNNNSDEDEDMKTQLKSWARAVALASDVR